MSSAVEAKQKTEAITPGEERPLQKIESGPGNALAIADTSCSAEALASQAEEDPMAMKGRAQVVGAPLAAFAVAFSVMAYVPFALASGGNDSGVAGHISSFTATPSTITLGESSTLTWHATDISRCIVRGPGGVVVYDQFADGSHALSGPAVVTPQSPAPYTYIVNCYDFATGTIIQKDLVITVNAP